MWKHVIQLNGLVPLFEQLEMKRNEMLQLEKSTTELKSQLDEKSELFFKEKELLGSKKMK